MGIPHLPPSHVPTLRLFSPDDEPTVPTLPEFFANYYRPIILEGERQVSAATLLQYTTLCDWWVRLTPNPPIDTIDKTLIAQFVAALKSATYRRGRFGKAIPLSPSTVHKLNRLLRSLLNNAHDEGVIAKKVRFVLRKPTVDRKRPFTLDQARAVIAAADRATLPSGPAVGSPRQWWRGLLALQFYTGLRVGAALAVRKSMLYERRGQTWLHVPGSANTKTCKALDLPVHPCLAAALAPLGEFCFPLAGGDGRGKWRAADVVGCRRQIEVEHQNLQRAAGIAEPLGFHAWRRTHAEELAQLGLSVAMDISRRALQHGSSDTTRQSYTDPLHAAVLLLPWLWEADS